MHVELCLLKSAWRAAMQLLQGMTLCTVFASLTAYVRCAARVLYTVVHDKKRPATPEDCPSEYRGVMESCWHEDPMQRCDTARQQHKHTAQAIRAVIRLLLCVHVACMCRIRLGPDPGPNATVVCDKACHPTCRHLCRPTFDQVLAQLLPLMNEARSKFKAAGGTNVAPFRTRQRSRDSSAAP